MPKFMLTTVDNPFDPFTKFSDWLAFDMEKGYQTCEFLAAFSVTSTELSTEDQDDAINEAIDQVVRLNPLGIFKKVEASSYPQPDSNPA